MEQIIVILTKRSLEKKNSNLAYCSYVYTYTVRFLQYLQYLHTNVISYRELWFLTRVSQYLEKYLQSVYSK